jgi:hypothetical protein
MVHFVAYIDESGDPGLRAIRAGSSQWFVISCLLVQEHHVPTLANTHERILSQFRNRQTDFLHFKNLLPFKKSIACAEIAKAPCRAFCVISNKINILNYRNPNLGNNKDWLYWWMTRILLERVTEFCHRYAQKTNIVEPKIRIVFSRRSSNDYDEFKLYLRRLQSQSTAGGLYINEGDITWPLYDPEEIHIVNAKNLIGLQLADTIAGAVYNGLETGTKQHNLDYIQRILPVMARNSSRRLFGYGVKSMPPVSDIILDAQQREFFTICDYRGRWAPGP